MRQWDTVMGLEVHAQLSTASKLFSGAATRFGASPNRQTCFIDAGLPGVLPVLNGKAVELAIRLGLALSAQINSHSTFERKNYFYPDLPKGYQISQYQQPIISQGTLVISLADGRQKTIDIVRAHLEEDAGKSVHGTLPGLSGIDLNRAGTPLLEIVTAPCFTETEEVIAYLKSLHQLLRFLGICDGNMQEGSFRCDVNLSIKPAGSADLGTRTELKNLNSFKFIEKAIAYERQRQIELIEEGGKVIQETRLYCPDRDLTLSMRGKENENDYRYFPDPDLLPIVISPSQIEAVRATMPLSPAAIAALLAENEYFNAEDQQFILSDPAIWTYVQSLNLTGQAAKIAVNWLKGPVMAQLNSQQAGFTALPIPAEAFAALATSLSTQQLSQSQAKKLLPALWQGEADWRDLLARAASADQGQDQTALRGWVEAVIANHPEQVADYRAGKEKILAFLVGQVMKASRGQAEAAAVSQMLKDLIG